LNIPAVLSEAAKLASRILETYTAIDPKLQRLCLPVDNEDDVYISDGQRGRGGELIPLFDGFLQIKFRLSGSKPVEDSAHNPIGFEHGNPMSVMK